MTVMHNEWPMEDTLLLPGDEEWWQGGRQSWKCKRGWLGLTQGWVKRRRLNILVEHRERKLPLSTGRDRKSERYTPFSIKHHGIWSTLCSRARTPGTFFCLEIAKHTYFGGINQILCLSVSVP